MADATSEYAAANGWREIDISGEEWRAYRYADGTAHEMMGQQRLFVKHDDRGETHRIINRRGMVTRPERGWVAIEWRMSNANGPAFIA